MGERPEVPERLSQTFLRHYSRCNRSGALYLKHRGGPSSHQLDRGTAVHRAIQKATETCLEEWEATVPPELMQAIVDEIFAQSDLTIPPEDQEEIRAMAYHWAECTAVDLEAVVGVERKVVLELGGWRISCVMDFAWREPPDGRRAGVDDYKSSKALPDWEGWGDAHTDEGRARLRRFAFQTILYALALVYGRPVREVTCPACTGTGMMTTDPEDASRCLDCNGRCYVEELEDAPLAPNAEEVLIRQVHPYRVRELPDGTLALADRRATLTRTELQGHRAWLEGLLAQVGESFETGRWDAVPGSHCAECPARRECPLPEHLRGLKAIETQEDAAAVAARVLALEAERAELLEQLKTTADRGFEIVVGDRIFEFTYAQSRGVRRSGSKADIDGLIAAVRRAAETGEPLNEDFWFKTTDSVSFGHRRLKPDEVEAIERRRQQ